MLFITNGLDIVEFMLPPDGTSLASELSGIRQIEVYGTIGYGSAKCGLNGYAAWNMLTYKTGDATYKYI